MLREDSWILVIGLALNPAKAVAASSASVASGLGDRGSILLISRRVEKRCSNFSHV